MDNLEGMDKFLKKYNLPKLNQEEIENLNRSFTSMEIETIDKISVHQSQVEMLVHSYTLSIPDVCVCVCVCELSHV